MATGGSRQLRNYRTARAAGDTREEAAAVAGISLGEAELIDRDDARARQAGPTAPMAELPRRHFGCILADPPWHFSTFSAKGRDRCPDAPLTRNESRQNSPVRHYSTMSLDDIKALPVEACAAADCLLMLWAVDPMIPQALDVGAAWGFTFKTVGFYWAKTRRVTSKRGDHFDDPDRKRFPMGTGYWTRANPETCLLFTRGRPKRLSAGEQKLIVSPRREHSRKPDEQYERIERLVAGPYLELFARSARPGWSAWGNEVGKFQAEAA